jgi:hypothetical protein
MTKVSAMKDARSGRLGSTLAPLRLGMMPASRITSFGSIARIRMSISAAPEGLRSPRCHLRTVPREAPVTFAKLFLR